MRLEESSLYGKVIIPWYDGDRILATTIVAMAAVFLFGLAGIVVACQEPDFRGALWVPATLVVASFLLLVRGSVRLFKRRRLRRDAI